MPKNKMPQHSQKKQSSLALVLGFMCLAGILLLPTTLFLCVTMAPTLVAAMTGPRVYRKSKALTIGAFNFAGCFPFLLKLWMQGHSMDASFDMLIDVNTLTIVFSAAGIGYIFQWMMSNLISGFMVSKAKKRLIVIQKRQAELVEQWGKEVSGYSEE